MLMVCPVLKVPESVGVPVGMLLGASLISAIPYLFKIELLALSPYCPGSRLYESNRTSSAYSSPAL